MLVRQTIPGTRVTVGTALNAFFLTDTFYGGGVRLRLFGLKTSLHPYILTSLHPWGCCVSAAWSGLCLHLPMSVVGVLSAGRGRYIRFSIGVFGWSSQAFDGGRLYCL